jgi:hypothetical protein
MPNIWQRANWQNGPFPLPVPISSPVPSFNDSHLEAMCKILADTDAGLKGSEIGRILAQLGIEDSDPTGTKWKRLFLALCNRQCQDGCGNNVVRFLYVAMDPVPSRSEDCATWNLVNVEQVFNGKMGGNESAHLLPSLLQNGQMLLGERHQKKSSGSSALLTGLRPLQIPGEVVGGRTRRTSRRRNTCLEASSLACQHPAVPKRLT